MPPPVRPEHPEPPGQLRNDPLEHPRVGAPRMQQHQRRPDPVLLVVGPHLAKLRMTAARHQERRHPAAWGGRGADLPPSKRLAEAMGGTLDLESTPQRGGTFAAG
jgi:hypothetical protein